MQKLSFAPWRSASLSLRVSEGPFAANPSFWVLLIFVLSLSCSSGATDVDNSTDRYLPLPDSLALLDKQVDLRMKKALLEINRNSVPCAKPAVFRGHLKKELAPNAKEDYGVFEVWAEGGEDRIKNLMSYIFDTKKPGAPRHRISVKNSIYNGSDRLSIIDLVGLASSIRLNGHYVGTDKLGHFFDQGYIYFSNQVAREMTHSGVLEQGVVSEKMNLGAKMSGVYAYGDLAANYSGWQFWKQVAEGDNPYFTCIDSKWTQVRKFTWADYVSDAWDEGLNCSKFEEGLKEVVERNLKKLEADAKRAGLNARFQCPADPRVCENFAKMRDAQHFINPDCLKLGREMRNNRKREKETGSKSGPAPGLGR